MSTALQPVNTRQVSLLDGEHQGFVTLRIAGQMIGISVLAVQDVLRRMAIARVPLSPSEIAGVINLRGRIITVIDMHRRLGLTPASEMQECMHCVVEHRDEMFSLMVDSVGDVLNIPINKIDKSPSNLEGRWKDVSAGVCQLEGELLVILDIQALLTI